MSEARFAARYSGGRCAASCGEPIIEGEMLTYADDQLVHLDCADSLPQDRPAPTVCTSCYLTHPCDCEDE